MRADQKSAIRQPGLARAWLIGLVALLGLATGMAMASSAGAAPSKFVYELCDPSLPGGNPPAATFAGSMAFTPFQTCAQEGGSIGITETAATDGSFGYGGFGIPATPGGLVESVTASGAAAGLGPGNDHTYAYEQGWPQNNAAESKRTFQNSAGEEPFYFGESGFRILMNCDGNVPGGCGPGPTIAIHYIAATEVDPHPPTLSSIVGSLLVPEILRGHHEVSLEAKDEGGGISKVEVLVNGIAAAAPSAPSCSIANVKNLSYTGIVAVSPAPCPSTQKASWLLDTSAYPFQDGANTVQLCASDFSTIGEANRTCSPAQTIAVDNSCTESPVAGGTVLTTEFARSHSEDVTVPYEATAKVTGELADTAGDAIPGATICVEAATQGSRKGLQPVGTATTDANGHFIYAVPAGPNRELLMGYRHDTFQVGRRIHFYSHTKPTIEVSTATVHNGGEIKIRGKLPGRRAGGRVLILEASSLHGKHWYPFERVTTNKHGIYHGHYRFNDTPQTTIYKVRAEAPPQHSWPWKKGRSKPVLVEVRG